jgi:8-oxo-dGTP pyrophosphatase MutT (NUDIX family)
MVSVKFSKLKRLADGYKTSWIRRPSLLQVAALCHRPGENGREILLVTSLGRGHWILPKGWPKKKVSSAQTALEEAFEEAGIRGKVSQAPIGTYHYTKAGRSGGILSCVATVYEVVFSEMAKNFPEKGERKVKWFKQSAAAEAVSSKELAEILRTFEPSP